MVMTANDHLSRAVSLLRQAEAKQRAYEHYIASAAKVLQEADSLRAQMSREFEACLGQLRRALVRRDHLCVHGFEANCPHCPKGGSSDVQEGGAH
jgi:hypothetical protein